MDFRVDPTRDVPPSRQIVEAILDGVASGALAVGDRLPSVRGLAASALVNPNTVGKAYRDLEHMEVVVARNGDGVFVSGRGGEIAQAARRAATLVSLRQAAQAAVRAGHDAATVQREVDRAFRGAGRAVVRP